MGANADSRSNWTNIIPMNTYIEKVDGKSKPEVWTMLSYDHRYYPGEENKEPSLTVPDQALSIQELLSNYTENEGYLEYLRKLNDQYDDDDDDEGDDLPDPRTLDLVERSEIAALVREELEKIRKPKQKHTEPEQVIQKPSTEPPDPTTK